MDNRIWTRIGGPEGSASGTAEGTPQDLMLGALQALERLLQAGRVQDLHGETLIDLLRRDAGSLMYRRESFLAGLAEIEGCLVVSPTPKSEPSGKLP